MEKESGYSFSSDRFLSGAENYPLCKAMVDHDQQRVKARGGREVSDQVARDLLEGARGKGFNGSEQGNSGVCSTCFAGTRHSLPRICTRIV